MSETRSIEVIIIGAGLAGLATTYGLQHLPGVHVRVLEKRKEDDNLQPGYPVRLSPDGRQALKELLTPQDHLKLLAARNKLPSHHDGITMLNASGKVTFRRVQSPGHKCLVERQDLVDILKAGLTPPPEPTTKEVDHEEVARSWRKALETSYDAEGLLGESAQTWRQAAEWARVGAGQGGHGQPQKLTDRGRPGAVVNGEMSSEEKDESSQEHLMGGVQIEYEKSVKDIVKMANGWQLTLWDGEVARCDILIGADGMFSTVRRTLYPPRPGTKDPGFEALPLTILNMKTTSLAVRRWVKDPEGMIMIYGKGWSAALCPLGHQSQPIEGNSSSVAQSRSSRRSWFRKSHPEHTHPSPSPALSDSDTLHPGNSQQEALYAPHEVYVALTIPHPQGSLREAITSLPGATSTGSFLADLLADPGLKGAQAFPLWSARRTCAGGQRAVLIGDASHGMVPYCGAGASAALKDAAELVSKIQNHIMFGGNLDFLLDEFHADQKARNDPLILTARRILWLIQGDNTPKRIIRSIAFGAMEMRGKGRREAEDKLLKWKTNTA